MNSGSVRDGGDCVVAQLPVIAPEMEKGQHRKEPRQKKALTGTLQRSVSFNEAWTPCLSPLPHNVIEI